MQRKVRSVAVGLLALACLFGIGGRTAWAQPGGKKFVSASATAPKTVTPGKPFTVTIALNIDNTFHIQADKTKEGYIPTTVEVGPVSGFKVSKIVFPKAVEASIAGDKLPVFEGKVAIKVTLTPDKTVKPGKVNLPITVKYQGCTDVTCFPPSKVEAKAEITVGGIKKAEGEGGDSSPLTQTADTTAPGAVSSTLAIPGFQATKIERFLAPNDFQKWLKEGGTETGQAGVVAELLKKGGAGNFVGALGLIYLLGLALNLTPCVYPLIPITIGYFGRQASSGAKTGTLSIFYALGMALMYSGLGIFAALAGSLFGSWLQNPAVLVGFALVMFALGLSMFDRPDGRPIWELQLPSSLTSQSKARTGYVGALLMGLMVGIVAAPCIGPVVVALIQIVGETRNVSLGLVTFFILGVGLATPYLLLGFGLIKALPRAGEWMISVKHIFGLLLFAMGIYYLRDLLGPTSYPIVMTLFLLWSGVYLIFLDKAGRSAAKFQMFKNVMGVVSFAVAATMLWPVLNPPPPVKQIAFQTPGDFAALEAKLEEARKQNKRVLIDFWATWCAACKELEEKTFTDPEVIKETENYIALRVQLQDYEGPNKLYVDKFQIVGLPTVVHLIPTQDTVTASR